MWAPTPKQIITQAASGAGNMGDVTDETSTARFSLKDRPYVLSWMRIHFGGTGSGATADVVIKVDSRLGQAHDAVLYIVDDIATAADDDGFVRIERDEYEKWVFQDGDVIVVEWTNPDTDNLTWAIEAGLAYA
jgi:hypothetical protein